MSNKYYLAETHNSAVMDPTQELINAEIERYKIIDETIARGDSKIQQFYAGAVVFITGGSGFLGKQLIEKLFRSCEISKLYMLLRSKKGRSVDLRLEKFFDDPVFDKLHRVKPDFSKKIFPVLGDVTKIGLGISEKDWTVITNEVTVIFHGAATISFIEPLKVATLTNVRASREMLLLGKACKNLKAYVHISTAYSHATEQRINKPVLEKFYDTPISPSSLIELAETLDEKILNNITPELIKDWPNTYSFTKAVTEEMIRTMGGDLPICIVRPAVVIGALREPEPGWIDPSCIFGPSGFLLGIGIGALHAMHVKPEIHLDFVAVDLVNNAIIAAAKETADRSKAGEKEIKIYTVTGCRNPIAFGGMADYLQYDGLPSPRSFGYLWAILIPNRTLFLMFHWLIHAIPAYIADFVLRLLRKKPKAVKLCNLVATFSSIYEYYLTNEWKFDDVNYRQLYFNMSSADRRIFDGNTENVDWEKYISIWCIGIRQYVLKDGLVKSVESKKKQFWFRIISWIVLPTYLYVLFSIAYGIAYFAYYVVFYIIGFFV